MDHDVLDIDLVRRYLAAKRDHRTGQRVAAERDRTGGGEKLGAEPIIGVVPGSYVGCAKLHERADRGIKFWRSGVTITASASLGGEAPHLTSQS
jgi:hypothetical protein